MKAATPRPVADEFGALREEIWQQRLEEDPFFAMRCGEHRFNDRLPDASPEGMKRHAEQRKAFLARLRELDTKQLGEGDRTDHGILSTLLEQEIALYGFGNHLLPINRLFGFHTSFLELPNEAPLRTEQDYRNYIARLAGFLGYMRQQIGLMREGIQRGITQPRVILEGLAETARPHAVEDPAQSLLYKPFKAFPSGVPESVRVALEAAGRTAIEKSVAPAYRALVDFLEKEYLPAGRATTGCSSLPAGGEWYATLVKYFTTVEVSPREVHETGLKEVERIRGEMMTIVRAQGFQGTLAEFVKNLRDDSKWIAATPEALEKEVGAILKRIDGELPKLFGRLPRMPYGLKRVPDYTAPYTATAYYEPPNADGTKAGFFFLNTHNLRARPLYEMEALSLHEAVPGHHLQIALQQEADLHPFRRHLWFTAFGEGWALYAERLGLEMGFYQDAISDFGRLTYEMWRACRLVIDTGLHALGWTREQSIAFLSDNTGLSDLNIRNEVDRYISWPGQALAYKMGEIKIRQLRARAEEELGGAFDLRAFHDRVLAGGGMPLGVLEELVEAWIRTQKAA